MTIFFHTDYFERFNIIKLANVMYTLLINSKFWCCKIENRLKTTPYTFKWHDQDNKYTDEHNKMNILNAGLYFPDFSIGRQRSMDKNGPLTLKPKPKNYGSSTN